MDEVGWALLARCETIRRVTGRRCPECGEALEGAWGRQPRDRPISCPGCGWSSTWQAYHRSYKGAPKDGSAWVSPAGSYRMVRGGGWGGMRSNSHTTYRTSKRATSKYNYLGFRIVRAP